MQRKNGLKQSCARIFAADAHSSQRYGDKPYTFHLDQVVRLLLPYGKMAETIGYLHDVVEDTEVTSEEIAKRFGQHVAGCVAILSDQPGANRLERKIKTYAKMKAVTGDLEMALIVKAADRLANIRACIADGKTELLNVYRNEHPQFHAVAFRQGQCDELWLAIDAALAGSGTSAAKI